MNTNTQTVDERCAECADMARLAMVCAYEAHNAQDFGFRLAARRDVVEYADRIIALRTAEAAQCQHSHVCSEGLTVRCLDCGMPIASQDPTPYMLAQEVQS